MPLCLGPKKTGSDKAGGPCSVWDFVVNPETIKMAEETPAIKKVLIETVRPGACMEKLSANHSFCQFFGYELQDRTFGAPNMHVQMWDAVLNFSTCICAGHGEH